MREKRKQEKSGVRVIVRNRRAGFLYEILERFEAGIALRGSEVKSLRAGKVNISDAYATIKGEELFLLKLHIAPYEKAAAFPHDPERPRRLLLHRREIRRLVGKIQERGLTIVPLQLYFKGPWVKVELGLVRGKKKFDKREAIARRDQARELDRARRGRDLLSVFVAMTLAFSVWAAEGPIRRQDVHGDRRSFDARAELLGQVGSRQQVQRAAEGWLEMGVGRDSLQWADGLGDLLDSLAVRLRDLTAPESILGDCRVPEILTAESSSLLRPEPETISEPAGFGAGLGEQPLLEVVFADGRSARTDPLEVYGGIPYWDLRDFCSAFACTLSWKPQAFAGTLRLDSLELGFVVGSEFGRLGDSLLWMGHPVIAASGRVLLPLTLLEAAQDLALGTRYQLDWPAKTLRLRAGGQRLSYLEMAQAGARQSLRWYLDRKPGCALSVDPAGFIVVALDGVHFDPLQAWYPGSRGGTLVCGMEEAAWGSRYYIRPGNSFMGCRCLWLPERSQMRLVLTSLGMDLAARRRGYVRWPLWSWRTHLRTRMWEAAGPEEEGPGRRPLVVLVVPQAQSESDAYAFAAAVGRRAASLLRHWGLEAEMVPRRNGAGLGAALNDREASVVVVVEPWVRGVDAGRGAVVCVPAGRPGRNESISRRELKALGSERDLVPWSMVLPLLAPESVRLGASVGLFLQGEMGEEAVTMLEWPLDFLEGTAAPVSMVLLGSVEGSEEFPTKAEWAALGRLAGAVAWGILAYARSTGILGGEALQRAWKQSRSAVLPKALLQWLRRQGEGTGRSSYSVAGGRHMRI